MADTALLAAGGGSTPLSYKVPGATSIRIKQVHVKYVDNGAGGDWLPAVQIVSDSNHLMGTAADQAVKVTAGSDADVSFFPYGRRRVATSRLTIDYNLGELCNAIETNLFFDTIVQLSYQGVSRGDGILVLLAAPSVPSGGALEASPQFAFDSQLNTYTQIGAFQFEASPPNVNEGVRVGLFFCPTIAADMVAGTDYIEGTWDNNCYDRYVAAWAVRHSGGAHTPTVLAATADHDAVQYAATSVRLTAPNFTPARDRALMFALIMNAKAGGTGGFGGIAGWNGFFQAESRGGVGSKQFYTTNPQTHGADAYLIAGAVATPYEDDVGVLPAGVLVPSFNGVAQAYTLGANAWKGIILLGLD